MNTSIPNFLVHPEIEQKKSCTEDGRMRDGKKVFWQIPGKKGLLFFGDEIFSRTQLRAQVKSSLQIRHS